MHAPLEDHALPLLEMVSSGSCTPILNQLLNLPLVQVTLDRVQPIPEFVRMFSYAVAGTPVTDPPPGFNPPHLSSETPESPVGIYDFCRSPDGVIAASETLIPVRSVNCDHLQCFDLSSYLTINKKRPRWSCPVCSLPAPFRDLRRDDFFVQLMADQSLKDAEMVHVDANGHWREASKVVQSDSSVVMPARASIAAIPSDKPTIAAIPSLLNGASTMSPSILESNFSSRPVTPIEPDVSPFNDCVILLDTDDDDDGAGSSTRPQQTAGVHPTSSNSYSGQPLHAFVTDKQSEKRPPEAFDSALRKVFVGLAASSDDEFAATASAPLLSNLQSPEALALSSTPTTTNVSALVPPSCLHPGVTSPVPDASRLLTLAENAAPPPPRPPLLTATAAALVVSTSGTSSTPRSSVPPSKLNKASDLNCELLTSFTSSVGVTTAFAASMQLPEVVRATMGYVIPPSKEAARTPEIRATYSRP
ncbi:unnamed protein product [Dibothriocephalus latus]|uniref:SP-RING-type domain-containing protein n=1 Tax=Dibothriocephalus latus TaxID=60516 RepID=A0A3P7M661_DIBLA|nr:unnamed protein product [Dibothriocephalus latus]